MRLKVFLSLLLFFCLSAVPAFAAIPLITSGTQGKGKFHPELFGEYSHDKEDRVTNNSGDLSATITYGIATPIDIVFSIPYQSWRTDGSNSLVTERCIGDLPIAAKWRFSEIGNWSFALKPGLTIPSGSDSRGLGSGKATCHVLFITTYNFGEGLLAPEGRRIESPEEKASHHIEWSAHFNAGYTRDENSAGEMADLWSFSAAGSVELIEDFYVIADRGGQTSTDGASSTNPVYFWQGSSIHHRITSAAVWD